MKIYDISQEVFSCAVYPGDDAPQMTAVRRTARGEAYNLTNFSMCAHNGTHIDAPFHFLGDGKTVEQLKLTSLVGECYVADAEGLLSASDAKAILKRAAEVGASGKLLLRGDTNVTPESARVFADAGIELIGLESQSVGEASAPAEVHRLLLSRDIVLLEGLRLSQVNEGAYFLCAAPLSLAGADGAPCRAILIAH